MSASDPGLTRLKQALRVTLSVIWAVIIMALVVELGANVNITAAILAGLLGLMGNVTVNDDTEKEQKVTTLLLPFSSALSVTLAATLSLIGHHIPDIALLTIVFLTFYLQRFGVRYFSICMIAFISFYFSTMLGVKIPDLPWYYVAILIGMSMVYLFHFILLPDQPDKVLKHSLASYHVQINSTFDLIVDMIRDPQRRAKRVKSLNRKVTKINEYARMVAGQFEDADPDRIWPGIRTNQLRLYVFDSAMLIETLSPTVQQLKGLHALEIAEVRQLLMKVMQSLRRADILREKHDFSSLETARQSMKKLKIELDRLKTDDEDFKEWLYLLRRIYSIINHVTKEAETIQRTRIQHINDLETTTNSYKRDQQKNKKEQEDEEVDEKYGLRPSTQKAFQAALSGAVSITIGYLVSPSHQYWVLLANFVILFGTESVGRTVVKAAQRFAGTLFGAIAGFVIAHLISGETYLEFAILFFCVFMAFYFVSLSYAIMIFWITMMLANMYNLLLGGVTESLLGARVIDTLIGAGLGASVTIFLFPHTTKDKIRDSMIEFLSDLKEYVDAYLERFIRPDANIDLADKALELEEKLQQIRDDADPLKRTPGSLARSGIENRLTVLTAVNYYAKQLVASANREDRLKVDPSDQQTLKKVELYFRENTDALCELLNGHTKGDIRIRDLKKEREWIERSPDQKNADRPKQRQLIHELYYVWRINQAITSLAKDLGAHTEKKHDETFHVRSFTV